MSALPIGRPKCAADSRNSVAGVGSLNACSTAYRVEIAIGCTAAWKPPSVRPSMMPVVVEPVP